MKRILLLAALCASSFGFAQVIDVFNYTGLLSANGWTSHSGTAGQFSALTTTSDVGNSLSYPGLPTSTGNRATFVAGNSEDVNYALTGISGTAYYSFLLKVTNTTGLTTATNGDYFTGFGATSGASVSVFGARTYIKAGTTAGTFQIGIMNTGGGASPTPVFSGEYPVGTTVMVVIKLDATVSPIQASLFVNPVLGAAEPTPTQYSTIGTNPFSAFASIFLRQAGNSTSGTGNLEIDEIRVGSTWASVTPLSCGTASTLNVSNCGPYTLNSQTYSTSGTYTQVLANANSAGCDSTITLHLTVNSPSSSTLTETACGSYTLNSQTYNTSGTYTQTIPNAAGCDSTITLNLSIVSSLTYYEDADGDGLGNQNVSQVTCAQPQNFVTNNSDCDDSNSAIGVGATYYADADNDGLGNAAVDSVSCTQPVGYVSDNTDCNDNDNLIGAPDSYYADVDGDGFGDANGTAVLSCTPVANHVLNNTDCNDNNAAAYPGATEIANNGIDEDCNGTDLNTLGEVLGMYVFATNDCTNGVEDLGVTTQPANATFSNYSTAGTDCASGAGYFNRNNWNTGTDLDTSEYNQFTVTPADCNELELTRLTFTHRVSATAGSPFVHIRSSLDNFATDVFTTQITVPATLIDETVDLPAAFASITDSVTFRFYVAGIANSGATYRQDNVAVIGYINALTPQTYYADADSDGFGDNAISVSACEAPAGYVSDNTDCNDNDADQNPNAVWYADVDSDGFGTSAITLSQCTQPLGYVANADDCNDADSLIGAGITYFQDADNDGFGNADSMYVSCTAPEGYVTNSTDCDDTDDQVTIATTEFFIDADNDGFGSADQSVIACSAPAGYVDNTNDCDDTNSSVTTGSTFYEDADNDGFGDATSITVACTAPQGYVADNTDCDDTNAAVNPDATDNTGNGIDENCDGVDGNLGLEEAAALWINIAPNPGQNEVTIALQSGWNINLRVEMYTVDGKSALSAQLIASGNQAKLETASLISGVYFIRVTDGTHTATVRWVKNN